PGHARQLHRPGQARPDPLQPRTRRARHRHGGRHRPPIRARRPSRPLSMGPYVRRVLVVAAVAVVLLGACGGGGGKKKVAKASSVTTESSTTIASTTTTAAGGGTATTTGSKKTPSPTGAARINGTPSNNYQPPAGSTPAKPAAPATYKFDTSGATSFGAQTSKPPPVTTLRVDPPAGTRQHSARDDRDASGNGSVTETTLDFQPQGVLLVELKITTKA